MFGERNAKGCFPAYDKLKETLALARMKYDLLLLHPPFPDLFARSRDKPLFLQPLTPSLAILQHVVFFFLSDWPLEGIVGRIEVTRLRLSSSLPSLF